MKTRFASVAAGVATLATTGALLLVGVAAANAAAPPFQTTNPDPNEVGTLTLYSAAGTPITSGSLTDSPLAAYYVGSTPDAAHKKATQYFYTPNSALNPSAWNGAQATASTSYPVTDPAAPASITSQGSNPVETGAAGDTDLADYIAANPNTDTTAGYAGVYEIRVKTSTSGAYWAADISVSGNTWTQVFPTAATPTTTTVATSGTPSNTGDNVTFTATVADSDASTPAGAVTFSDGATAITGCTAVAVTAGTATCATTALAVGSHTVTAAYTPTSSSFGTSSGQVTQVVTTPHTATTTTLTITGNTTTGTDATLAGTVAPTAATGTVSFFDGTSTTPLIATPTPVTGGTYTDTLTGGFADGSHSITAVFTPDTTSAATYNGSQSSPQVFTTVKAGGTCVQTGSSCTDTQTFTGTVPAGTLVISTPYTAAKPLDLGTLKLNAAGTLFSGTGTFQCITITDSNGANTGFVAQAAANTLSQTSGPAAPAGTFSSIDGQNVGLTGLAPSTTSCPDGSSAVNSYTGGPGSITVTDNAAAAGVNPGAPGTLGLGGSIAHTIMKGSANGVGTATYDGTLTLNAPTNTAPGVYTGQIVFTVSDGN